MIDPATVALTLWPVLNGLALGVVSYNCFADITAVLKGRNKRSWFSVCSNQLFMAAALLASITLFPAFQVPAALYWGLTLFPILAALNFHGYYQIKNAWGSSKNSFLKTIIYATDKILSFIPDVIFRVLNPVFNMSYAWLAHVFLGLQLTVFAALVVMTQPIIGIAGLSFVALNFLKAKDALPKFMSAPIEKINSLVLISSGLFLKNTFWKIYAGFNIAYEAFSNLVLPMLLKTRLGKDSEFLQMSDVVEVEEPKPIIPRNISKQNFRYLLSILPPLKSRISNEVDRMVLLKKEIEELIAGYREGTQWSPTGYMQTVAAAANSNNKTGIAVNLPHMAFAKNLNIPPLPYPIDFKKLKEIVYNSGLEKSIRSFKAACFESPQFRKVDEDVEKEFEALRKRRDIEIESLIKLHQTDTDLQAQIDAVRASYQKPIAEVNQKFIAKWREKLGLHDASDDAVIIEILKDGFEYVCQKVETGKDLKFDKTEVSIAEFKQMGCHDFIYLQDILTSGDKLRIITEGHDLISMLGFGAGHYCPNAVIDIVLDIYQRQVFKILAESEDDGRKIPAADQLKSYLQRQRQTIFEFIYNLILKDDKFQTYIAPFIDLLDRHTYSKVVKLAAFLHLPSSFNAESDLTNINNVGFLRQIICNYLAYVVSQVIIGTENGYSADAIVEQMLIPPQQGSTQIEAQNFTVAWKKEFEDAETKDYIHELLMFGLGLDGSEVPKHTRENALRRLYTLMLLDLGVFKTTHPELDCRIKTVLQTAANNVDINLEIDTSSFEMPPEDIDQAATLQAFMAFKETQDSKLKVTAAAIRAERQAAHSATRDTFPRTGSPSPSSATI